ncbi:peptidyl-prolyl cis-trans isomerase [Streptantibioticus rubrisoli]|uniref:Peptidylprolyl isomerase n=1 Tax=Streptantibioticus rubrisoli TaxID=1387313 RepID=A0ABT1P780_9ACTN|nr:peptidylprolyl isomerase [Streptantibioticus rubrisoli]MCQ4041232.1 peptidylprolyl isomerase [Streptantibioticus rubrisoli]
MSADGQLVARVGGSVITTVELDQRLADLRSGPLGPRLPKDGTPAGVRLRRWVAQLLASEALLRHETGRSAPSLDHAARTLFERVTADVAVSEAELFRYYRDNLDLWVRPERRTVRQAVRSSPAAAVAVCLDDLGAAETLCRGQLAGPFEDAVFSAAPGAWIGPVRTVFGWHVAVLHRVEPGGVLPYEAVRESIHADLLSAARGQAFDDWLASRRAALVHLSPGYEHPGDPSLPDAVHRH